MSFHIGIDLGGTKIFGAAVSHDGATLFTQRRATPRHNYQSTILTISDIVSAIEAELNSSAPVGICIPGSICPKTGLIQNANSTWLNDQPFNVDLEDALDRQLRFENDANCFALSESVDGSGKDANSVFGVIMGTGVGGGLVIDNKILNGPRSIGGEWGHCSLPFPKLEEQRTAALCWCGQKGCIESWISGPALIRHHNSEFNASYNSVEELINGATSDDADAQTSLEKHASRTARALSMVVNIADPETIILGGGLSELDHLYDALPKLMAPTIFSSDPHIDIRRPQFGPTSGVRGAARLWEFY